MTAPVIVDGALWGELFATWHGTETAPVAAAPLYVVALAAVLGSAISRTLHAENLEKLASCDPLTGVANRRALDAAADQTFASGTSGSKRRISAVAIDVNELKSVNDAAGHDEGDRLLVAISALLVTHFKPLYGSLVARVGGDEFSVLVPGHPVAVIEQAAHAVCAAALDLAGGYGVSCGIASTIARGGRDDQRALFSAADHAMYQAKRHGIRTPVLAGTDPRGLSLV
jgi:diguanylate cyclase (GGDEF)-like protein